MMAVECRDIGTSTVGKAAMTKGMSNFVLVVYSNALGSIILLPFVLSRSLAQMLESTGVKYSSPTLSSAMSNLIPIFTYVLAILIRNAAPFAAMMAVECTDIGISTLSKAAMTKGMSNFVFVVYANALGSLLLLPFVLSRSLAQILESTGVKYSSPTLSSAMGNLVPIFTYVLAIFFRMEELDLRSSSGVAKFLGAWVSVLGAFTVTLYKGQKILSASPLSGIPHQILHSQQPNWVLAGLLLSMAFLSFAVMGIFQWKLERNLNAWKLNPDIELISVVYSAILGCVVHNSVCTWCLKEKGPVFVAMFKPVGIAIAVVMASLFLGEPLYLGSVIGAVVIALGFYTVMWGKIYDDEGVGDGGSGDGGWELGHGGSGHGCRRRAARRRRSAPRRAGEEEEEQVASRRSRRCDGEEEEEQAASRRCDGDERWVAMATRSLSLFILKLWGGGGDGSLKAMSQGYGIELYFDPALENQVLKAWNVLARRQISTHLIEIESRPHITLFSTPFTDPSKLENIVKIFASKQESLPICFSSIGSFPNDNNALFLAPTPSSALLQFHSQLWDAMKKEGIEIGEEYRPDSWIPNCSVAEEVPKSRMAEAFTILRDLKLPVTGYAMDIGLVEFSPVREIFSYMLGNTVEA
ncbi:hypothetical protein RHGRI_022919 [Rhododendron griersonianum]|uniref:EamA domain-containing protein n=1 Tax=Rhododendron griersonianum TaxID=479676 RepID=A0AAV6J5F2_9ERIC|nr:hypothetical protein RHGRI_022919 [Rhododendron griersonianum]